MQSKEVISDNVGWDYLVVILTKRGHYGDRRGTFSCSMEKGNGRS